jgi:F420-non-reducing hydrogenase iron-sulfur subunit
MTEGKVNLTLFYCQKVPESSEGDRQVLEKSYGTRLKLFPLPCGGRLEAIHLLKALEEDADAVYLITCPEGTCAYVEGNLRAIKRVERTREIIAGIGLERERVGIVPNQVNDRKTLMQLAEQIMEQVAPLGRSAVHKKKERG